MDVASNHTGVDESCWFLKSAVEQTSQVFMANVVTCILDAVVFLSAPVSNALIVYAIWKTNALHSPSNTLLCCLAITDCLTGLAVAPLNVLTKVGEIYGTFEVYCISGVISSLMAYTTASVSFLTLALIAVERYLALYLHLRYISLVTSSRIVKVIAVVWVYMTTLSTLRFVDTKEIFLRPVFMMNLTVFLTVTVVCYCKIYSNVLHHRRKMRAESVSVQTTDCKVCDEPMIKQQDSAEMARYRRATMTMVYIVGCFFLCYFPSLIYQVAVAAGKDLDDRKTSIAYKYCFSVVLLKSSVDPVLYCWRISYIRRELRKILAQIWRGKYIKEEC